MTSPGTGAGTAARELPHDYFAEEALLGAVLVSGAARDVAATVVRPEDFLSTSNGDVFAATCRLHDAGATVDPVVVAGLLGEGRPDPYQLVALMEACPAPSNAAAYAEIVAAMATLRRVIVTGRQISEVGYQTPADVASALSQVDALVSALGPPASRSCRTGAELVHEVLDEIEAAEAGNPVTGLTTGLPDLDRALGGLHEGHMVIIGGRPSMGKTALATGIAAHIGIKLGLPVYFASAEMSGREVMMRMIGARARLSTGSMRSGGLSREQHLRLTEAVGAIGAAPLVVEDAFEMGVATIRAGARRLRGEHGRLGAVIVDYIQLLSAGGRAENRQVEVSQLSRALKILARELRCPVIVLSQLSRNLEQRVDKRPVLADLRESGSLEQDSDAVLFAYRDEKYNPNTVDRAILEILIAKNRSGGPSGISVRTMWQGEWMRALPLPMPSSEGMRAADGAIVPLRGLGDQEADQF
jgi:replicative DNA helicase